MFLSDTSFVQARFNEGEHSVHALQCSHELLVVFVVRLDPSDTRCGLRVGTILLILSEPDTVLVRMKSHANLSGKK